MVGRVHLAPGVDGRAEGLDGIVETTGVQVHEAPGGRPGRAQRLARVGDREPLECLEGQSSRRLVVRCERVEVDTSRPMAEVLIDYLNQRSRLARAR